VIFTQTEVRLINWLLHQYRKLRYPQYRERIAYQRQKLAILSHPRYQSGTTDILGPALKFTDSASCHFIYQEVFEKEIYKFTTQNERPYILDAGANIGLSVIYFKRLFPGARIVAFEPDADVFKVLSENVAAFGLNDVTLICKALWNKETTLEFHREGADAGRVAVRSIDEKQLVQVSATRLDSYIRDERVDLLKVDIEGAETAVLSDCAGLLKNVDRIFVEYHSFVNQSQTLAELLSILQGAGFRLHVNSPGFHSESPFVNLKSYIGMDMQLNIYGWRT
jgi:FkbM family methyltransferase